MSFLWHIVKPQLAAIMRLAAAERPAVAVRPSLPRSLQGSTEGTRFAGNGNDEPTTALCGPGYPDSGSQRLHR
jgi:hypothetical protein